MGGRLPQPQRPRPGLRISQQGNLLEDDCVILDTRGLGDRRMRKAAAREELQRRKPRESHHLAFSFTTQLYGMVRSVRIDAVLEIDLTDPLSEDE